MRVSAVLVMMLTALWWSPSSARSPVAAQRLVDKGTKLFKAGSYESALEALELAYAETGDAVLQYPIGRCHEELGHLAAAALAYERFLGSSAPAAAKSKAQASLDALRDRLSRGRLVIEVAPAGAEVRVDGQLVGVSPVAELALRAGRHVVEASAPGCVDARVDAEVPPAGVGTAVLILERLPVVPQPPESPEPLLGEGLSSGPEETPGGALSGWGWALLGTGTALVAGGALSYGLGESDHRQIVDTTGYGTGGLTEMTRSKALELESSGELKKTVGYALWGAGGVSLITSVILLAVDVEGPPVSMGATPTEGGAIVGAQGSF